MENWHITFTRGATADRPNTFCTGWSHEGTHDSAQCSAMHAILAAIQASFGEHPVSWPEGCTLSYQRLTMLELLSAIANGDFTRAFQVADRGFAWTFTIVKSGLPPIGYPVHKIVQEKARGLLQRR